jgi:hypothetical protein
MRSRETKSFSQYTFKALGVSLLPPTSSFLAQGWIRSLTLPLEALEETPEVEAEAEAEEEATDHPFRPPPPTTPVVLPVSRAGRRRAPTMKALEAEKVPKRGVDGGKVRRAEG